MFVCYYGCYQCYSVDVQLSFVTAMIDSVFFFFFFFFMNGNTERAQCALSRVCILKKRKRKAVKRIKQIYKTSKRVIKKRKRKIMPSDP